MLNEKGSSGVLVSVIIGAALVIGAIVIFNSGAIDTSFTSIQTTILNFFETKIESILN